MIKYKYILDTLQNELANLQILEIYVNNESNKINNFWPKTLEKIKNDTWLLVYIKKVDYSFANFSFAVAYNEIQKDWYTRRLWNEFNYNDVMDFKEKLKDIIKNKIEYIEKTKKTLKDAQKIEKNLIKIIELVQKVDYKIYNSQVVASISNELKDSFYLPDRLKR